MKKSAVVFRVLDGNRLQCEISTPTDKKIRLSGTILDLEPTVEMSDLGINHALVRSAWVFAKTKYETVSLEDGTQQQQAVKRAEQLKKATEWIADVADDISDEVRRGWCSACLGEHSHRKANRPLGQLPAYLCEECGSPTLPCAGLACKNMAVRDPGAVFVQRYCAEHTHEITGFAKADRKMETLNEYDDFLEYDKPNLVRAVKMVGIAGAGAALASPLAFMAAPAVGGAVGALVGGFSGAAATSWGLAALAGGSLAAGGLGMAGGTLIVTAVGAAVGGALGATVTNAYVREDSSFHIELLRGGTGTPVVVCNGFLSEAGKGWGEWKEIITKRYPDSPVYRVHWGAKELKNLGMFGGAAAVGPMGLAAVARVAARAARGAAKKLGPIAPALIAADLAKNPWHVAKNRAEKTGAILADLLARTKAESYILVGHSLGARAMVLAAQTLSTKSGLPRIKEMHLLGAAIGARNDWSSLTDAVDERIYNYHSSNDNVLKYGYTAAEGGQSAAGLNGFTPASKKLVNIDSSVSVHTHFDYHKNITLSSAPDCLVNRQSMS